MGRLEAEEEERLAHLALAVTAEVLVSKGPEKRLGEKVAMADKELFPRGGHGGSVEIVGEQGIAEGGNGGRGGALGYGRGGDGGGGTHFGPGHARGGDGGDAGRPARPALGAPSPMCYTDSSWLSTPGVTDIYGIPQPGRGGDSYMAYVTHAGYRYCLNILLRLLDGPILKVINVPQLIDTVDTLGFHAGINTEQEWWNLAVEKYPDETSAVMAHMRICEKNDRASKP